MKLLYTHSNRFLVLNAKNLIEIENISVLLKNEYSSGGVGELPPTDNWLELWVVENMHFERAFELLKNFNTAQGVDWMCNVCSEKNGSAFEYCWKCNTFQD